MATPRLGLVVEGKPTELSCNKNWGKFDSIDITLCTNSIAYQQIRMYDVNSSEPSPVSHFC